MQVTLFLIMLQSFSGMFNLLATQELAQLLENILLAIFYVTVDATRQTIKDCFNKEKR